MQDTHTHAQSVASILPGGRAGNLRHILSVRADRVRQLRAEGWSAEEIRGMLGLTYRQQRYALQRMGEQFVPGGRRRGA